MTIQLYQGDCLEIMRGMDVIDVVVTDPPYGIGENNRKNLSRDNRTHPIDYGDFDWDEKRVGPEYIREILRVSKQQVIFGGNYYADLLPASSSWIVWDKLRSGDFADCELAWTSHTKAVRKFAYLWNGMMKQHPERRYHPTQKPLSLMTWVILNYTEPGDTVLDPFCGSGTTGVACIQTGRNFIGIDRGAHWIDVTRRRIEQAQAQLSLFSEAQL